jgi:hypothetical protein
MRYDDYNRGTATGKTYRYAGCLMTWINNEWVAYHPDGRGTVVARAKGIKPMRDILHSMKINKEGPWHES